MIVQNEGDVQTRTFVYVMIYTQSLQIVRKVRIEFCCIHTVRYVNLFSNLISQKVVHMEQHGPTKQQQ